MQEPCLGKFFFVHHSLHSERLLSALKQVMPIHSAFTRL